MNKNFTKMDIYLQWGIPLPSRHTTVVGPYPAEVWDGGPPPSPEYVAIVPAAGEEGALAAALLAAGWHVIEYHPRFNAWYGVEVHVMVV